MTLEKSRQEPLYMEEDTIVAEYCHPKSNECVHYDSTITICASGKMPIRMDIKFEGGPTPIAPMPPKEHRFRASTIIDLHEKYVRWFRKYGYIVR
jgi:hypothetical protein